MFRRHTFHKEVLARTKRVQENGKESRENWNCSCILKDLTEMIPLLPTMHHISGLRLGL